MAADLPGKFSLYPLSKRVLKDQWIYLVSLLPPSVPKSNDCFYLVRLVEEIYHTSLHTTHKAEWVTNDIQTEYQYIQLLNGLIGVVINNLRCDLLL